MEITMEDRRYLSQLSRVKAPAGFEQTVLTRLRERQKRRVRIIRLELGLAGVAALFLVGFLIFWPGVRKSPEGSPTLAGFNPEVTPEREIHVVEPIDLRKELRRRTEGPQAVYILEQVSDSWIQQIRY